MLSIFLLLTDTNARAVVQPTVLDMSKAVKVIDLPRGAFLEVNTAVFTVCLFCQLHPILICYVILLQSLFKRNFEKCRLKCKIEPQMATTITNCMHFKEGAFVLILSLLFVFNFGYLSLVASSKSSALLH